MIGSRTMVPPLAALLALAALVSPSRAVVRPHAKVEFKIATLAPEGSTWMQIMDQLDTQIREKTAGEAGLKIYPGGVQGDESVVLRKIRAGQLHGGGFTGVGLGEIAPGLRVMEVPFLFRTLDEVHAVRDTLGPVLEQMLWGAGWELLGWSDVGFVYLFTKQPIRGTADLHKVRMWLWEGDPLAETLLKTVGVSPVPLPITDVVTSLQTGLIDAVYTSPLACIALQWFTRVSYMTDFPVTHATGAVVISSKAFEQLSPAVQATVKDLAKKCFAQLNEETAKESAQSIQVLQQKGIQLVTVSDQEKASFEEAGRAVRERLANSLYSQDLLDQVLRVLARVRAAGPGSRHP